LDLWKPKYDGGETLFSNSLSTRLIISNEKRKKERWSLKIQRLAVPYNNEHFCMCKDMYIFTTSEKKHQRYYSYNDMDHELVKESFVFWKGRLVVAAAKNLLYRRMGIKLVKIL